MKMDHFWQCNRSKLTLKNVQTGNKKKEQKEKGKGGDEGLESV